MVLAGAAVCAAAMTAVSVAWACTPGGNVNVNPGSGLAGSTARVSGSGFVAEGEAGAAAAPVQIRWNSTSGPVLATASAPSFSTAVTIPEGAAARTYYVVAVQRQGDGSIVRQASAPFTVTAPAGQTAPATASPAPQPQPQPQPQPEPSTGSQPEAAPAPAPAATESTPAPAQASPAPAAAPAAAATAARRQMAAGPADTARTRSAGRSIAGGDGGPPSGSPAVDPVAPPAEPPAAPAEPAAQAPAASPRSASADVWSGFGNGSLSGGPSLIGSPAASPPGNSLGLGVGLLALGTVGLLGGALVGVRSRRRPAAAERTS